MLTFHRRTPNLRAPADDQGENGRTDNIKGVTPAKPFIDSAREKAPDRESGRLPSDPSGERTKGRQGRMGSKYDALTPEERWNMIAVAAYYRAEQHGFVGESPVNDWIAAEKEIDRLLQW